MCIDINDTALNFCNKIPPFLSDHNLIDVEIKIFLPKPPMDTFSYRKLNDITPEAINEVLIKSDWSSLTADNFDLDQAVSGLSNNLQAAIDLLAPVKTINPKKSKHPWIDKEFDFLMHKRKSIERRYLNSKTSLFLLNYFNLRKKLKLYQRQLITILYVLDLMMQLTTNVTFGVN